LSQREVDIVHLEADMVQAFAALFEKARDAGVRRGRTDQLDAPHPASKDGGLYLLTGDLFNLLQLEPEHVAVELNRRVQVLHRDSAVTEPLCRMTPRDRLVGGAPARYWGVRPAWTIALTAVLPLRHGCARRS